nr:7TM GPCR domain containing protein [Haemonchus contortus]
MITNTICLYVDLFLFIVCILQILANSVVLLAWCTSKRLLCNDNLILLISLAFIDFVYAVLQFPYLIILIAGSKPDGAPLNYDPWVIVQLAGPSAALMKSGCTITTAIAIDRVFALYFPFQYFKRSKRNWSIGAFVLALLLALIDWVVLQLTVTIRPKPYCTSFGCFTNAVFRAYWGLSNMLMNLLSCILTMVILYHLWHGSVPSPLATEIERQNKHRIDKSANGVALYILLVSALLGVVPGCLNCLEIFIHVPLLDEIAFFVGTCASLSGLLHAFIFAMAHRDIREYQNENDVDGNGAKDLKQPTSTVNDKVALSKNTAALKASDEKIKVVIPEAAKHPETVQEGGANDGEVVRMNLTSFLRAKNTKESSSHGSGEKVTGKPTDHEKPIGKQSDEVQSPDKMGDPPALDESAFETLEKPEILDEKEESNSEEEIKRMLMEQEQKAQQKKDLQSSEGVPESHAVPKPGQSHEIQSTRKPETLVKPVKKPKIESPQKLAPGKIKKSPIDERPSLIDVELPEAKGFIEHPSVTPSETCVRKSASMIAVSPGVYRSEEPPIHHYKFVHVRMDLEGKPLDANLTENLVLIFIPINSPAFYHLVIGDQIVEINGLVPRNLTEFQERVEAATGQITFGVVRPWNVRPPTPERMAHVWTVKKYCYLIVELPFLRNMPDGFEFQCVSHGRLHINQVMPQSMGAFAFLIVDRIIDIDSVKIPHKVNMVALKNRIRAVQERDGFCSFLVERPSSLHHLTNPSCVAMKSTEPTMDVVMADDAVEIGCREAFKHIQVKDRKHRHHSIYGSTIHGHSPQDGGQLITAEDNDDVHSPFKHKGSRRKRRKLKIGKNPKEKPIPSDVKQGTPLSKASEGPLRKLVTKFISKTLHAGGR